MKEEIGVCRIIIPRREDLPRLLEIERSCFSNPWTENLFKSELEPKGHNHALAAISPVDERIIGYCFFWMFAETEGHILNLAVDHAWRRKGVANALIREVIRQAERERLERLILEVRVSNLDALNFYARLGFKGVGRRAGYYDNPKEDALILSLALTGKGRGMDV